jgi:hypothetical protein
MLDKASSRQPEIKNASGISIYRAVGTGDRVGLATTSFLAKCHNEA